MLQMFGQGPRGGYFNRIQWIVKCSLFCFPDYQFSDDSPASNPSSVEVWSVSVDKHPNARPKELRGEHEEFL
jgi:hypothetical protein